jgi:hypothetical protein
MQGSDKAILGIQRKARQEELFTKMKQHHVEEVLA